MSGWKEIQKGRVKIEHFSTASLIKITATATEDTSQGVFEEVENVLWLDYGAFADLRSAINKTDFP